MQGGLSRNKVAVGESAAGSPPNEIYFGHSGYWTNCKIAGVDKEWLCHLTREAKGGFESPGAVLVHLEM